MSTHTQQTKKRRPHLFICILILLIALACIFVQRFAGTDIYNKASLPSIDLGNENEADGEWCLILVNKWHPLETDSEIDLTELSNGQCVDSRIYPQLQKMFDDMRDDGVYPVVASGYRTEQEQQQIYDESMAEYIEKGYSESDAKTETERWVAIPGTSEHQLGLGVDINADGINSYGYEVYNWLAQNAYRYGFIYRYPENKVAITGIANEPWHYRYVGVNAATEIYKRGICLEEYLGETNKEGEFMKRKRLTQVFPFLLPIRKWQRKKLFYLEMLIDGNKYAKNKSEALLPNTVFETSSLRRQKQDHPKGSDKDEIQLPQSAACPTV